MEVVLDGDLLAQGTDYTVFYSDNVNAGKGSVKITGTGDYTGSANAEFTISPASISGAAISGVKSAHAVEEIFVPLLKKLTELQKKRRKGRSAAEAPDRQAGQNGCGRKGFR